MRALPLLCCLALSLPLFAQAPPNYYNSVDTSSAAALRSSLHAVIDDHLHIPYSSGGTDTWVVLELADQDPLNSARILDVYRNASYAKVGGGNPNYDREHSWPNSYGFPNDSGSNYPYSDCHQLFLCDIGYNGARANKPYRECASGCTEMPTLPNGGAGGGSGSYPGQSNWSSGSSSTGSWETWIGRRGDVARALLYLDLRYEGGVHGTTGAAEPDLVLTDDDALIQASATGQNESVAYMGLLSVLLAWHAQDPVDAKELARNDVVFGFQGNRNPFIDHPEWAALLWPPPGPQLSANLGALDLTAGGTQALALSAGSAHAGQLYVLAGTTEGSAPGFDFGGVHIPLNPFGAYFQLTLNGPGALLAPHLGFLDGSGQAAAGFHLPAGSSSALAGITLQHAYVVLSPALVPLAASNAVPLALVAGSGGARLVINEIDYDQSGSDTGEFIEIHNAGSGAALLANTVLELWNGATGQMYNSIALSAAGATLAPGAYLVIGTAPIVSALPPGVLSITFANAADNVQNGAPDGLLLRDGASVLDGVSYEGAMAGIGEGPGGAGTDPSSGSAALARVPNGVDTDLNAADFVLSSAPTPGAANS